VRPISPPGAPDPRGVALCLVAAIGFGAMAILAKEAYAAGTGTVTLLAVRFLLAAAVLWTLVLLRRGLPSSRRRGRAVRTPARPPLTRRTAGVGLLLGAGYAVEAAAYFAALRRIDAALASLLLYLYPGVVAVAAARLRVDRLTPRRVAALGLTTTGAVLALAGAGTGAVDPLGAGLAVLAAVLYSAYILCSDRAVAAVDPMTVTALVATGAAACFTGAGLASGTLDLGLTSRAWAAAGALAIFSTVLPIAAFLAGMRRVGPSTAAILSTVELLVTIGLAVALLGERLAPAQLAGAALVLAGVVLLQWRAAGTVRGDEPAPVAARPAHAREVVGVPA
jgi:drug/metabolite transporter (DMT)-like permease